MCGLPSYPGSNIAHFARDALWLHGLTNDTLAALGFPTRSAERVLSKLAATECLENDRCSKAHELEELVLPEMEQFMEDAALAAW